jgi:hypothetical protein
MAVYFLGDVEGRLYVDLDMPQGTSLEMPSAKLPQELSDISPSSPTRCTKDVRQCPDGSYVSRSGPNCAFAPCPTDSLEAEGVALEEQINLSGEYASYDFASGIVQQYLEGVAMFQLLLNAKLEEKAFDEKVAGLVQYTQSLPEFQPDSTSTYTFPMMTLIFVPMDGGTEDQKVEFFRRQYGAQLQSIAMPGSDIEGDTQLTFPARSPIAEQELFTLAQEASMNPELGAEVAVTYMEVKSLTPKPRIPPSTPPPRVQPSTSQPNFSFTNNGRIVDSSLQLPEQVYSDPIKPPGSGGTYTDPIEPNPYAGFQWDGFTQGPESLWYQQGLIPGPDGKYIDGSDGPGGTGDGPGGTGDGSGGTGDGPGGTGDGPGGGGGGSGGGGGGSGGGGGGSGGGGSSTGGGTSSGGTSDYDDEDFEVAGYKDGWIVYRNLNNGNYYTNRGEAYGGYRRTSF